eukprot:SAG31_NODE_3147_length_4620_cov_1.523114_1_plen_61_part_10
MPNKDGLPSAVYGSAATPDCVPSSGVQGRHQAGIACGASCPYSAYCCYEPIANGKRFDQAF